MKLDSKTFEHKDIQQEYDGIFQKDPIKDEDRAYQWFATDVVGSLLPGARVLDLACGGGYFLKEVGRQNGVRTVGLDISGEAIKLAKGISPQSSYVLGVGEFLPFRAGSFDYVTCLGSLEHFLDPQAALTEIRRILAPGGKILILVPNLFWYKDIAHVLSKGTRLQRNQSHEMFAVESEWAELLGKAQVRIDRVIKYNGRSHSLLKQFFKELLIPRSLSYHFIFLCSAPTGT